jgi:hypothetical protein
VFLDVIIINATASSPSGPPYRAQQRPEARRAGFLRDMMSVAAEPLNSGYEPMALRVTAWGIGHKLQRFCHLAAFQSRRLAVLCDAPSVVRWRIAESPAG